MEQFTIKPIVPLDLFGLDLSLTNSALWMLLAVVCAAGLLWAGARRRLLVPDRIQSVAEQVHEAIAGMVRQNVGAEGMKYFPFVLTLFLFVLFGNLLGLIPGSFTYTSHIVVTFALAALVFFGVTIIGFLRHGLGYFKLLVPEGVPLWLTPLIVPIELVSYLSRPLSLSVRLFANMTVGHVMLKVLTMFIGMFAAAGVAFGVVGAAIMVPAIAAITALEFLIAVIQAYVFAILTCIYLHDAVHMH